MTTPIDDSTPAVCAKCFEGCELAGEATGTMDKLAGLDYYVAKSKTTTNSNKAVIYCYDIFGLSINNPKLMADKLSERLEMDVYVVDYLLGDYANASSLSLIERPIAGRNILYRMFATTKLVFTFMTQVGPAFLKRHRPAVTVPLIQDFIATLRADHGVTRVGAIGYCWGGTVVTKLISTESIDVCVTAHPGSLTLEDFKKIEKPYALLLSEEDTFFDGMKKDVEAILVAKPTPTLVKHYAGTTHGFAARPDLTVPEIKLAFDTAFDDSVNFFKAHL